MTGQNISTLPVKRALTGSTLIEESLHPLPVKRRMPSPFTSLDSPLPLTVKIAITLNKLRGPSPSTS